MSWRRVPPVYSPISVSALLAAVSRASGPASAAVSSLEQTLGERFDARETVLTDSGTSALVLALRATVPPDGIVALPGYACIDVVAAAIGARVKALLYDLDPETLSPDLDSVRQALAAGARAVLAAPLYGYPQDLPALATIAREHAVPLIEDAAQGAGATLQGRRVGSFGDISVLSFGRGKGMTAGSGGALLVRRPAFLDWARAERARLAAGGIGIRDTVALAAQWVLARPLTYSIPSAIPALKLGEMVYEAPWEPRAISASGAVLLRSALAMDAGELRARREHAERLLQTRAGARRLAPVRPLPSASPGYLRLAVVDTTGTTTPDPRLGAIRGYPITLDQHAETQRVLAAAPGKLTGARVLRDRLFTLPTHSRVSAQDLTRLQGWLTADVADGAAPASANAAV